MRCKTFWQRIVPFAVTLVFGFLAGNILHEEQTDTKSLENINFHKQTSYSGDGTGYGSCKGTRFGKSNSDKSSISHSKTKPLQIISKPRPVYTDAARQNQIQGTVALRVTFTASGEIGGVSPVSNLPYGLTEQAILAARGIRFEPAEKNGTPQTVTKQVQYNFTIY